MRGESKDHDVADCVVIVGFTAVTFLVLILMVIMFLEEEVNLHIQPQFQVDSFSLATTNRTLDFNRNPPTANWIIEISVKSGDKRVESFQDFEVSVWYNNVYATTGTNPGGDATGSSSMEFLTAARVEDFSLGPKQHRKIGGIHAGTRLENSTGCAVWLGIADELVKFQLRVQSKASYPIQLISGHSRRNIEYDVLCPNLQLPFSSALNMFVADGTPQCEVVSPAEN